MKSSLMGRVVLGIAVVAAAVVLLVVLSDSEDDDGAGGTTTAAQTNSAPGGASGDAAGEETASQEPAIPTIVVKAGKPVGGVEELIFSAGDRVRFAVRADSEDEVHLHGYDIEQEVGPGRVARFDFPATIEGLFEAELHGSGEQIAELRVEP